MTREITKTVRQSRISSLEILVRKLVTILHGRITFSTRLVRSLLACELTIPSFLTRSPTSIVPNMVICSTSISDKALSSIKLQNHSGSFDPADEFNSASAAAVVSNYATAFLFIIIAEMSITMYVYKLYITELS